MYNHTLSTLEVFSYAASEAISPLTWDRESISRIETEILTIPSLGRLHGLILHNAIKRHHLDWFTAKTQLKLKTNTTNLIVDIAAKKHFIKQLMPLLEAHNISIILLKGMAFNDYIYDSEAPRGVSDIDILIKPNDKQALDKVFNIIATLVAVEKKHAFDGLYEQTWRSNDIAKHLIDVHTYLTNPILFNIEYDQVWQHSINHPEYGSESIRVLSPEHSLLHLTTHVINDSNFYHYNLIDAHELLSKFVIDTQFMQQEAKKWGLVLASNLLIKCSIDNLNSTKLSNEFKPSWIDNIKTSIAKVLINRLFTIESKEKSVLHRFKQLSCYLFVTDSAIPLFKLIRLYIKRK